MTDKPANGDDSSTGQEPVPNESLGLNARQDQPEPPSEHPPSADSPPPEPLAPPAGGDVGKTPQQSTEKSDKRSLGDVWKEVRRSTAALLIVIFVPILTGAVGSVGAWLYTNNREQAQEKEEKRLQEEQKEKERLAAEANPLTTLVSSPLVNMPGQYDFGLVVTEPDRLELGPEPAPLDSCPKLWAAGTKAGGKPATWDRYIVNVTGKVQSTVAIVGLRAKVTKPHASPSNGALFVCGVSMGSGPQDGSKIVFDLTKSDQADGVVVGSGGTVVKQFYEGFQLHVPPTDTTNFTIEAKLPADSVDWVVEADVVFDGQTRTVTINDNGRDFHSPGLLAAADYHEIIFGIMGIVLPGTWSRGNDAADLERIGGAPVQLPNPESHPEVFAPPPPPLPANPPR